MECVFDAFTKVRPFSFLYDANKDTQPERSREEDETSIDDRAARLLEFSGYSAPRVRRRVSVWRGVHT